MPVVKDSLERRVEQLEQICQRQQELIDSLRSRVAVQTDKRWVYLAKTIKVGSSYPTSGNTFGLQFLDREFSPIEGAQSATDRTRSATYLGTGRTVDGCYLPEGTVVAVFPAPLPPGTSGKGRWHILSLGPAPVFVGKADAAIAVGNTASPGTVSVWDVLFNADTGKNITGCINWSVAISLNDKVAVTFVTGTPLVTKLGC